MTKKNAIQRSAPLFLALGVVAIGAIVAFGQGGRKPADSSIQVNKDREAAPIVAVSQTDSARKPLNFYTGGVRKDLFSAPEPPRPKETPKPQAAPPPPPPAPPVVVNPFADYAYAGTVTMGEKRMALIENTKTKEGQYLGEGDAFMGGKISQISDRMVTVEVAGAPQMIAKRDDFKLTPLDKSAPYLQGAPAQGAPGAPGQTGAPSPGAAPAPGGPGGFPGMGGMPARFQQRMQERLNSMTPEQRQRMEERMNRWRDNRFEGRGGRERGEGRRERRRDDG